MIVIMIRVREIEPMIAACFSRSAFSSISRSRAAWSFSDISVASVSSTFSTAAAFSEIMRVKCQIKSKCIMIDYEYGQK